MHLRVRLRERQVGFGWRLCAEAGTWRARRGVFCRLVSPRFVTGDPDQRGRKRPIRGL